MPKKALKLVEARIRNTFARVQEIHDFSKKITDSNGYLFLTKAKTLDDLRKEYRDAVVESESLKIDLDEKYEPCYDRLNAFDELVDEIRTVTSILYERIEKAKKKEDIPPTTGGSPSQGIARIKIEPLQIPTFDGSPEQWVPFHQLFKELVHNCRDFSDLQKVTFLVTHLSGNAKSIITGIPPTGENYQLLYNNLVKRFEDKRVLGGYYFDKLMNFKPLPNESEKHLNTFLEQFVEASNAFSRLDLENKFDFFLFLLASKKLDNETMRQFDMSHRDVEIPSFEELVEFIRGQAKMLGRGYNAAASLSTKSAAPHPKSNSRAFLLHYSDSDAPPHHSGGASGSPRGMGICGCPKRHKQLYKCDRFIQLTPAERWIAVKKFAACVNCLSFGHLRNQCRSTTTCNVNSCGYQHHSLLHRDDFVSQTKFNGNQSTSSQPNASILEKRNDSEGTGRSNSASGVTCSNMVASAMTYTNTILLATAIVKVKDVHGEFRDVRALMDPGSQSHLITKDMCERLGLPLFQNRSTVLGLGSAPVNVDACATLTIHSRINTNCSYDISVLVVDKLINALPTTEIDVQNLAHISHLPLADPHCTKIGKIDMLIGAELWPYIVKKRKVFGPTNSPIGLQSTLGYLVMGRAAASTSKQVSQVCVVSEPPLEEIVQKFWSLESVPETKSSTPADQQCEKLFMDTYTRQPGGRFVVQLPFREPPHSLGNSLNSSLRQYYSMEKRLLATPALHEQYGKLINEYLADGTIRKLANIDETNLAFYLPHHGVFKPSSLTTPLRIVFNASARSSNGKSLNDILYVGEKLQNDVFSILLNFRLYYYVLCTDIRRMFLQILIHPEHRCFLRFLWRYSSSEPVDVFEFNSLVFGLTCSPYLAQRVVKQLCILESPRFPLACEVVERDSYIDDISTSVEEESQLFALYDQLSQLFEAGGFSLSKWCSNSKNLLNHIPESARVTQHVSFDRDEVTKVLGVQWQPREDSFTCSVILDPEPPTKRRMLSLLARIFDPLGLVSPITTQAKLLIREMWARKIDWDEELPAELHEKCVDFQRDLPTLSQLSIPRYSNISGSCHSMLLGFADASERAYGAVVYVRSYRHPSPPQIRLLCSRSRIAPMKTLTIPRLELCAAMLLSKLMNHVIETYKGRHVFNKIMAFSDSMVTLHWIRSHPSQWKIFVANRVAQIQQLISPELWYFVPGESNPADVLSRGSMPKDFISHPLWFNGPDWLSMEESLWPQPEHHLVKPDLITHEVKSQVFMMIESPQSPLEILLQRISSYRRLLRATAYVFRVFRKPRPKGEPISPNELKNAETYWIKWIQNKHFHSIKSMIKKGQLVPDAFRKLDVFIEDDILRVGGRLHHAKLSLDHRHPILLPKHDRLVNLIIDQYHVDYFHAGTSLLIARISQKFWIMSAGVRIRSRVRCCYKCFRANPVALTPKMASLPAARVQGQKAFANSGVDYAGPFLVSWSRRRGVQPMKAYVCLFVCFAVKAVHLELVSDLSTDKFLSAYKRFLARRGPCTQLTSDCGTNFVGARNRLDELHQLLISHPFNDAVASSLSHQGVNWKLNPSRAPHFGGLWESNIKSVKSHLKRVVGSQIMTYEEFNTILTQIEAIMNSRPLCKLSSDPIAPSALTPAHFLTLGSTLNYLPMEDLTSEPLNRLTRFQLIDRTIQEFWKRWRLEYLHTLQARSKWTKSSTPIPVGTVVVLMENNLPPLQWPLGVVEALHPGSDGEIRVVTVRTASNTLRRPVVKVCPLPSDDQ